MSKDILVRGNGLAVHLVAPDSASGGPWMKSEAARSWKIGGDRLIRAGRRLILFSRADMPRLEPREYRQTAVVIHGQVYRVTLREPAGIQGFRYTLDPWPAYRTDLPGAVINYDTQFVAQRDTMARRDLWLSLAPALLMPFQPLCGFLPSGLKIILEDRLGLPARSSTFTSILVEVGAFFAAGITSWIFTYTNVRDMALGALPAVAQPAVMYALTVALLIDAWVRYGSYLRGDRSPYGLGEWILRGVARFSRPRAPQE